MTVGRANSARAIVAAVILGFVLFGLLAAYAPDSVAFSPNNYRWNGLEGVASTYHVSFTASLSSLPAKSVLVVVQPVVNYTADDVRNILQFLTSGGTLLVADKGGYANSLLQGLGTGVTIQTQYSINDPIYDWKAKTVPTALVVPGAATVFPVMANVNGIALNQPSPLKLAKNVDVKIATTSPISYEVIAGPNSTKVATGQFTVAAAVKIGNGTVFVVGDSQFLLNSEWTIAGNSVLIRNLLANASVFVDASHWTTGPMTISPVQLKAEFRQAYSVLSNTPLKYVMTVSFVAVALALVPGSDKKAPGRKPSERGVELTRFNREVLERVRKDRERFAGRAE